MSIANPEDVARAVAALAANPALANAVAQAQSMSSASAQNASLPQYSVPGPVIAGTSKYTQLLALIEELGKDVRPTYTGNRNCSERLKRGLVHARILVKECISEIERSARNQNQ
ncbi:unnamed protein product [Bursaphelenchus xylophilus]|uniref:(pine wood nematode) hypothetical protein n=1 Tax=Bursaphelenchus xylophilus TaxID=6326 RepID=A0A1I7SMJ7_BURXY|nr:unnamed protein product [Bursaphelenchus xylophilus]CAG9130254.1 unnamed protein product [Bursaphelenchus xylophilus]